MRRETAELILEYLSDYYSNLYNNGLDQSDMDEHADNMLVDKILKIASEGNKNDA